MKCGVIAGNFKYSNIKNKYSIFQIYKYIILNNINLATMLANSMSEEEIYEIPNTTYNCSISMRKYFVG